ASRGRRHLSEHGKVQPAYALNDENCQDQKKPGQAEASGADRQRRGDKIGAAPAGIASGDLRKRHGQLPAFCSMRINIRRAAASTMKVMKNRMRPRATSEEV